MKTKLCLALVVTVLLALLAVPALAGTSETPMWVSRVRLAHTGRSTSGTDAIVALVRVRDANRRNVAGATVTVRWTVPNAPAFTTTGITSRTGYARLSTWTGSGTYGLSVINVVKPGWQYTPVVTASAPYVTR